MYPVTFDLPLPGRRVRLARSLPPARLPRSIRWRWPRSITAWILSSRQRSFSAAATLVGVGGTVAVAIVGFRISRSTNQATIDAARATTDKTIEAARDTNKATIVAAHADVRRTLETTREGQITERFTRAIDQLGHAHLDVRLGGIYGLERIARDSPDNRVAIGEPCPQVPSAGGGGWYSLGNSTACGRRRAWLLGGQPRAAPRSRQCDGLARLWPCQSHLNLDAGTTYWSAARLRHDTRWHPTRRRR